MNTDNPFDVSELCSGARPVESPFENPNLFRVEGNILVCGKILILPQLCAHGLANENLIERRALVQFASFRPVLVQRSCSVTYFVNKTSTHRYGVFFAISAPCIVAIMLIAAMLGHLPLVGVNMGLFLLVAAFIWWKRNELRLTLVSYEAPGIYRIRGFSQSYLETISRHAAD